MRSIDSIIDAEVVSDSEIIFVVEQYIKDKTGRAVSIDISARMPAANPNVLQIHIAKQLHRLFKAFQRATDRYLLQRWKKEKEQLSQKSEASEANEK